MQIPYLDLKPQFKALETDIRQSIDAVLEHGKFIMGPEIEECEKALAKYVGTKHALTCASGTDAAVMALMALDLEPGSEIITTAFSFIATAETILLAGHVPVYVDIDPVTFNIDVKQIAAAITAKTRAIVPVSLFGQIPPMQEILTIAKKHNLFVIEDAAQSFGGEQNGVKSGAFKDIGVTSFFPAKPLGCYGDGGAVFTDDDSLAQKMKVIREHGQTRRYHHERIGINGRLDSIQCGIVTAKLKRFPWEVEQRNKIAQAYHAQLASCASRDFILPEVLPGNKSVWAQFTVRVKNRTQFQEKLQAAGVPTSVHYPTPMCDQPAYKGIGRIVSCEISRQASQDVLSLPLYADMPLSHVEHIANQIKKVLAN